MGTLEVVVALVLVTTEVEDLNKTKLCKQRERERERCAIDTPQPESYSCTYSLFREHKLKGWKGIKDSYSDSIPA